jgi:hypothetical protein
MHNTTTLRRSSCANFKWVRDENKPKLIANSASNKNGQESIKNLETMIKATRPNSQNSLLAQ